MPLASRATPLSFEAQLSSASWTGTGCLPSLATQRLRFLHGEDGNDAYLLLDDGNAWRLQAQPDASFALADPAVADASVRLTTDKRSQATHVEVHLPHPDLAECVLHTELDWRPDAASPPSPALLRSLADASSASAHARALLEGGDYARARKQNDTAITVRQSLPPDSPARLLSLLLAADIESTDWRVDAARARMQEARTSLAQRGDDSLLQALVDLSQARVLGAAGSPREAAALASQARATFEQALGSEHFIALNAGEVEAISLDWAGASNSAATLMRDIVERARRSLGPTHLRMLWLAINLAPIVRSTGAQAEAKRITDEVLLALPASLPPKHPLGWLARDQEARNALMANDIASALTIADRQMDRAQRTLDAEHPFIFLSLFRLCNAQGTADHRNEATITCRKAWTFATGRLGPRHFQTLYSQVLYANALQQAGQVADAAPLLADAEVGLRAQFGAQHPFVLTAALARAQALSDLGRHEEATIALAQLYADVVEQLGADHIFAKTVLHFLSRAQFAAGETDAAIASLEDWVRQFERWRSAQIVEPEDRQTFLAGPGTEYHFLLSLYLARERSSEAFRLAELTKGRTLLESMTLRAALSDSELPRDDVERLQDASAHIRELDRNIAEATDADARSVLRAKRSALYARIGVIQDSLRRHFPRYAALSEPQVIGIADARHALPADSLGVSYTIAEGRLYAFLIARHAQLIVRNLGSAGDLQDLVTAYRDATRDDSQNRLTALPLWRLPDGNVKRDVLRPAAHATMVDDPAAIARLVEKRLLDPLARELRGKRRWIISPDGVLAFVSFDGLPWKRGVVVDKHVVSYTQSFSVYALLRQRVRRPNEQHKLEFVGMGAADYRNVSPLPQRQPWPALQASEGEVKTSASLFRTASVYLHADATESTLRALDRDGILARTRRLLLATHAYVDPIEPMRSAVVLGRNADSDPTDGYVTAAKWLGFHLGTDLVVLSACDTGSGRVLKGEGVMGLPYALFVAGNQDALLTLTPVGDQVAAQFTAKFFRYVSDGVDNASALARAKRALRRDARYRDVRYWAPFILYGG